MPVYNPTQLVSGSYVGNDHLNPIVSPTAGAYTIEDGVTWYYNGSIWFSVTRPQFTQGGASLLYFTSVPNGVGFETLSNTPDLSAIDLETISLPTAGIREYLNHEYKTDSVIGVTEIPAGQWGFKAFASTDLAGHGTTLQFEVGTTDGTTTTWHFTVDSPALISSEVSEYDFVTVQPTISCAADDYIVVRASAISETNNTSVTWVHSSPTAYSCFSPPQIPTLHDDLSGLNAGEFRHLTLAKEVALDDLIANGGGGGGTSSETVTFVTDSDLTAGQPVVLNSSGHVGAVVESFLAGEITNPANLNSGSLSYLSVTYSTLNNKYLAVFTIGTSGYYAIGTPDVGGLSVSWSTTVYSGTMTRNAVTYDASENKFIWMSGDPANSANNHYTIGTPNAGLTNVTWSKVLMTGTVSRTFRAIQSNGSGKLVFSFISAADGNILKYQVGSLAAGGASITWGEIIAPSSTAASWNGLTYTDSGLFILAFKKTITGEINTRVGAISGSNVNWGAEEPVVLTQDGCGVCWGDSKLILAYQNSTNSRGMVKPATLSGSVLTWGDSVQLDTPGQDNNTTAFDSVNGRYLFANLISYTGSPGWYQTFTLDSSISNYTGYLGISQATAATASTVSVRVNGVDSLQSGLTPGTLYYLQPDGGISATLSSTSLGKALTSTKLLMKPAI